MYKKPQRVAASYTVARDDGPGSLANKACKQYKPLDLLLQSGTTSSSAAPILCTHQLPRASASLEVGDYPAMFTNVTRHQHAAAARCTRPQQGRRKQHQHRPEYHQHRPSTLEPPRHGRSAATAPPLHRRSTAASPPHHRKWKT